MTRYSFNFGCDQFQLAQMMITIGAVGVFNQMERINRDNDRNMFPFNTIVCVYNESDRKVLESMLAKLKINHMIECWYGE